MADKLGTKGVTKSYEDSIFHFPHLSMEHSIQMHQKCLHQFLQELSKHADPQVSLRLDANRAWSYDEALAFVRALPAALPLAYIEEPCRDVADTLQLAQSGRVPIALDESLLGLNDEGLAQLKGLSAYVIKPTLCGGLSGAARLARAARQSDAEPVVSAAFESGVGIRALVYLANELMTPGLAAGLDTWQWLVDDVAESGVLSAGAMMHVASSGAHE